MKSAKWVRHPQFLRALLQALQAVAFRLLLVEFPPGAAIEIIGHRGMTSVTVIGRSTDMHLALSEYITLFFPYFN